MIACEFFSHIILCYKRGHLIYKDIWIPFVGDTSICQEKNDDTPDLYYSSYKVI